MAGRAFLFPTPSPSARSAFRFWLLRLALGKGWAKARWAPLRSAKNRSCSAIHGNTRDFCIFDAGPISAAQGLGLGVFCLDLRHRNLLQCRSRLVRFPFFFSLLQCPVPCRGLCEPESGLGSCPGRRGDGARRMRRGAGAYGISWRASRHYRRTACPGRTVARRSIFRCRRSAAHPDRCGKCDFGVRRFARFCRDATGRASRRIVPAPTEKREG